MQLPDDPEAAPTMTHDEFRHLADDASSGRHAGDRHDEDFVIVPSKRDPSDTSDWICEYCGASNGSWRTRCGSCGNPREGDEVTYHEVTRRAQATYQSREDAERDIRHERQYHPEAEAEAPTGAEATGEARDDGAPTVTHDEFLMSRMRELGSRLASLAVVVAMLFGIIWVLTPHPRDIRPESFDWSRNIGIAELRTVKESDWSVPSGGRVYDEQLEHHYDRKVHDGWHDEEYTEYERQKTGTRRWTEYEDNGDGSYDAVTYEEDVYENVPVTRTRQVEDYHYEPVYDMKYYYEIERWKHSRDIPTSGNDQNPYWGEVVLSGATGDHGTGEEREDGRTEEYGVTCEDGQRYVVMDEEFWHRLEKGGEFTVIVHIGGRIEEYDGK